MARHKSDPIQEGLDDMELEKVLEEIECDWEQFTESEKPQKPSEYSLDRLVHLERDGFPNFQGYSDKYDLFIKPLHIDRIVGNLFSFKEKETDERAIEIIADMAFEPELRKERQKTLKFLMENKDLDEIGSLFNQYYQNSRDINEVECWYEGGDYPYKLFFNPFEINRMGELLQQQLHVLEKIASITKGTHFQDCGVLAESIKSTEWYKELGNIDIEEDIGVIDSSRLLDELRNKTKQEYERDKRAGRDTNLIKYVDLFYAMKVSGVNKLVTALDYFIGYAIGFKELQEKGANLTFPEFRSGGYRHCNIKGGVNFILYMGENRDKEKVPNDFFIDELEPIRLITGENAYGKTMLIKTRAVIQAFAQAGLPVIADNAELSYVGQILANIGQTEDSFSGKSTYQKINDTTFKIIEKARSRSLLILDEPTSGTYDLKAILQARLYLEEIARKAGYETWMVTHHLELTELANKFPQIINLTTEVVDGKYTYRIIPGIFSPTEETVVLDYPLKRVSKAIKENRLNRLQRLIKDNEIPEDRMHLLEQQLDQYKN
ncbi:hypothetical protein CEE44_00120 [Candidatus Woesearchaeota archaeon B3_Woes]|nr:MAG: hypothetical protein CEE44_00120 [Candidatus Woesearchaeota archaeon B3_Woes]